MKAAAAAATAAAHPHHHHQAPPSSRLSLVNNNHYSYAAACYNHNSYYNYNHSSARSAMGCRYATTATHADIQLMHARRTIVKRGNLPPLTIGARKGLYRAARSVASCTTAFSKDEYTYAEVVIDDARDEGGICVGVVPGDGVLNTVVGTGTTGGGRGRGGRGRGRGEGVGWSCLLYTSPSPRDS